jgi:hypothetical protein
MQDSTPDKTVMHLSFDRKCFWQEQLAKHYSTTPASHKQAWRFFGSDLVANAKSQEKSTQEIAPKCLFLLVGTTGFEPATL